MASKRKLAFHIFISITLIFSILADVSGYDIHGPEDDLIERVAAIVQDTFPILDRSGDFINDNQYNPFDVYPSEIEQSVEYDAETDTYIITEMIGDEYFRSPSYLTFDEYLDWRSKEQERKYFEKLAGYGSQYKSASGRLDPMSKIDIEKNLIDRLFGGNEITIEPQGSIDLNFGASYNRSDNPQIDQSQQRQFNIPDFGMDIKMNVDGKIGDKMDLGFNYDTNASFDFDRKIKLAYDSEKWTEDDIVKKIEAGNVSFPLRSNLIKGAQELFGLKTELQFGHLRLTGVVSQQRSKQQSIQVQNGATVQEFQIRPEEYDENRHFFLSHYHRATYETSLENLPYINNSFRITNIEVWISEDRPNFQPDQTMIAAIADIGETDPTKFSNQDSANGISNDPMVINITTDANGIRLPDNRVNDLYEEIVSNEMANRIEFTNSELTNNYGLKESVDFETFRGRKLRQNEYFYNPELGFISLNVRMRPNQVLAVSYEYFYTNNCEDVYKVGSTSDEGSVSNTDREGEVVSEGVLFTKLLKGSSPRVDHPTWDLMMKNVYPLRANQLDATDFEFDVFYEDDKNGSLKKFLPERGFELIPLLNLFGLDNLNSRNDPQPDGVFDFVPGITVVPQNSSIFFPVLEPFGDALNNILQEVLEDTEPQSTIDSLIDFYAFHELYDTSVVAAQLNLEKNKFVMAGKVKSSSSSEYSLGAWNIPQGSVRVTAGSFEMVEGIHYEVDYGIGRVRILDQSIIQQGVPVNISFEDNSVFSLQQRNMMGLRADYEINDNFVVGGTFLRLAERPFTQKVNIGDDPIKNRVFGLDLDYSKEAPWVTSVVDKLPFYSTNAKSNISLTAEGAALKPGHSRAINVPNEEDNGGVVSIDDFEGAVSGFPLSSQPNRWQLASIPRYDDMRPEFQEAHLLNDVTSGANRARLSWYVIDRFVNVSETTKNLNSYTRRINQTELFNRQIPQGQLPDLLTFDLSYFPTERGPYNFDVPNGLGEFTKGVEFNQAENRVELKEPETRWAGIMRYLNNNDFEAANYEFIEFWMLNPFKTKPDGSGHVVDEEGFLTFQLGNVSEDILYDNLQFYENALPRDSSVVPERTTNWGKVPLNTPINDAFPGVDYTDQDLGLDGLDNEEEKSAHADYIDQIQVVTGPAPQSLLDDVAADDFVFFNDPVFEGSNDLIERYKNNNNPQGNSPDVSNATSFQRGNPIPDKEDMNNNRDLDSGESFYEYKIKIANANGEIDENATEFIRETKIINSQNAGPEKWYRFRIPLNEGESVNGIQGFRSIQFIRILVNGYKTAKTFRLADFELIRNQWRKLPSLCAKDGGEITVNFNTDVVGVEENGAKVPFGYEIPQGIKQEQLFSSFSAVNQDENSLVMKFEDLPANCEVAIAKLNELDLRVFERMQMFVHAERTLTDIGAEDDILQDGDLSIFLRVGKDFQRHYYEYEIPLTLSNDSIAFTSQSDRIWPKANMFDFPLDMLIQAKKLRNVTGAALTEEFIITSENLSQYRGLETEYESISLDTLPEGHKIRIKGNPNIGLIKGVSVGIRNIDDRIPIRDHSGEIWINELRLTGLQERGGVAGLARMEVQMADLGNLTASASYSSIGWGQIEQKVQERALEEVIEYDVATNLELGKLLPKNWGIRLPFYGQYAKSIINPEFDAYDFDITVEDEYDLFKNEPPEVIDEISQRNQRVNTIKTFNLTNVRKERSAGKNSDKTKAQKARNSTNASVQKPDKKAKKKKPMPWNIENFSASYSYTESTYRDPILKADNSIEQRLGLDYSYSRKGGYIQPFKKLKINNLDFIKELNLNPLPNSFSFNTNLNRFFGTRIYRIPETPEFHFDDRRFDWERRYDLNWNLTKALKINFTAFNESYIDEARQTGIAETAEDREWFAFTDNGSGNLIKSNVTAEVAADPLYPSRYWKDNLKSGGRNTNYDHSLNVNYTLPMKYIPYMDWVDVKAQYKSSYNWSAGALIEDASGFPLAGVIQNGQTRTVTANLNFDKLYNKSKYLKNLDRVGKPRTRSRVDDSKGDKVTIAKDKDGKRVTKKAARLPGTAEKLLLRPIFMLRSVRVNYKEDFSTVIPGYTGTPEYFGLDNAFTNPGVDFVIGLQPNIDPDNPSNFLSRAANNGWITESPGLNQEVIQTSNQNFDAKVKIEPWKDFKIDVDFKKNYRTTHSEVYKNVDKGGATQFLGLAARDLGSFDVTYFNMQTLFGRSIDELFDQFESYRPIISARLPNVDNAGEHTEDGSNYTIGYGKQSSSVLVPAFLAAYTDTDPTTIDLDLENRVSSRKFIPRPNWTLRYDGLSKLPWFKDKFSSFTLEHGYSSLLKVSNFNTDIEYDRVRPFLDDDGNPNIRLNGNYYTRIEIPALQISENFNPIIGLKMKTKNDFTMEFEYAKSRDLNLKINTSSQLEEDRKTSFVFGLGYTIKDSNFLKKKKKRTRSSRTKSDDEDEDETKDSRNVLRRNSVESSRGSDMTFMLNLAFNDNAFYVHELDKDISQEDNQTRGSKGFQINPSVDYILNDNVTLRTFFDYNTNTPYGSNNFKRTNMAFGLTMRLSLN